MYDPIRIFTETEINQIKRFGISISNSMIPLEYKDHYTTKSGKIWDIDTYIHGVCKCLSMPHSEFLNYFKTKEYEDNTMCSNLELFFKICYTYKVNSFLKLKEICDFADSVFIPEAGRGIDVLLASFVKEWKLITAYDQDKSVLVEMRKYFAGELRLPFQALQINTFLFNFASINERTIIFGTCHNLNEDIKKQIVNNKNLIGILDGEVLS